MPRTFKMRCEKCKKPVGDYRMEMMIGSKGYRRYPVHVGACPKVRNAKSAQPVKATPEKKMRGARADFLIIDELGGMK